MDPDALHDDEDRAGTFWALYARSGAPLGSPESWPSSLRVLVGVMLHSSQPMLVAWGEDLIALYNKAHAALIGDRHAETFGRPLFTVWSDVSDLVEARFRDALAGRFSRTEGQVIPITRAGRRTSAHFDLSYTPVPDDGAIAGVLCLSVETTANVFLARRRAALLELSDRTRGVVDARAIVAAGVEALGRGLKASRVGYGEVQADDQTILLETSYVDGVEPLHGLFQLDSFGADNIAAQRRGQTVAHDDVDRVPGERDATWRAIETRAFASTPLIRGGRFRASLYANFREPHAWSTDEIALIEEIGDRLWDSLERARAEEALQRARQSLSAIFAASQEGLALCRLITDSAGRGVDYQVLDVNPAHRVLTGATRERMLARPISQVAPPIDPRWIESADGAVRSGKPTSFEIRSSTTGRWLDIHVSPVGADLFAQTFIDVTARHDAEEERKRLIDEMSHRVMNNFQMMAGILELQAGRSSSPEVRRQLRTAVGRARSLSELHQSLATSPVSGEVDIRAYLETVCDKLRATIDDPARIGLTVSACDARLDSAVAMPLGFIVNELVTNAIKYAFPEPARGEIGVVFERDGNRGYRLVVSDGGKGLPEAADTQGSGLGMRLVHAFVAQIGATLDVRHGGGVAYDIAVPANEGPAEQPGAVERAWNKGDLLDPP